VQRATTRLQETIPELRTNQNQVGRHDKKETTERGKRRAISFNTKKTTSASSKKKRTHNRTHGIYYGWMELSRKRGRSYEETRVRPENLWEGNTKKKIALPQSILCHKGEGESLCLY